MGRDFVSQSLPKVTPLNTTTSLGRFYIGILGKQYSQSIFKHSTHDVRGMVST